MDNVRTVSDTKRDFYTFHTRPISSVYRRVVEELLVELHLLSVNQDFRPDPIYTLGVVTTFERFMEGYRPEADKDSIFSALCRAIGGDPQAYRQQAKHLASFVKSMSVEELVTWLKSPTPQEGSNGVLEKIQAIATNENFKYSRVFGTGLYTLLESVDQESVNDDIKREDLIKQLAESWHLPGEKMQKDLELYRSNLEKMNQLLKVLDEMLETDRKKKEEREQAKVAKAQTEAKTAAADVTPTDDSKESVPPE